MTDRQLAQWRADRARQSLIGTSVAPWVRSRGDHMRRLNNGIAYRTFKAIKESRWL